MKNSEKRTIPYRSKLERWVYEFGGPKAVAMKAGVVHSAVNHWCNRNATPSLAVCQRILALSKGKLTLNDILEGTSR